MPKEFRFAKKRGKATVLPISEQDVTAISSALSSPRLQETIGMMGMKVDQTFAIRMHLRSLRGRVSEETIRLRREGLKHHSLDGLRQLAQDSNESQWTAHPAYYWALLEEIGSRENGTSQIATMESPRTPLTLL